MERRSVSTGLSRRRFVQGVGTVGLALGAGCGPWTGQVPPAKTFRLGWLSSLPPPTANAGLDAFRDGLRDLGYAEGRNIAIEYRYGDGEFGRVSQLAAELALLPVDIIVAGDSRAVRPAQQATSSIPIVMTVMADPVALGYVVSLGHPGGNITGLSNLSTQLVAKRLELLQEVAPGASLVAVVGGPRHVDFTAVPAAAEALGLRHRVWEVNSPADFPVAIDAAMREGADALMVLPDPLTNAHAPQFAKLAAQGRLPAMYATRAYVEAGGLVAYAPNILALFRRAAYYVDRILKGANPADLPVELPRDFEFVINLRTARALGLTIPQHVLLQATEVIP